MSLTLDYSCCVFMKPFPSCFMNQAISEFHSVDNVNMNLGVCIGHELKF